MWYNGDQPRGLNGYLDEKSNRLIGWVTMRQLRSQMKFCSDQRVISECIDEYSLFNEEKQSFQPGWTNETNNEQFSSAILKSFQYQTDESLDTYYTNGKHGIYSGNGYVYEFRGSLANVKQNLSKLHSLGWIDRKSRAIFIQMTLYNPNVQLFTSVTLLSEFLSTGGVFTSNRFEPFQFYSTIKYLTMLIQLFLIFSI